MDWINCLATLDFLHEGEIHQIESVIVVEEVILADELFPTASVIKLAVVVEYLAQVAAGLLRPNQQVVTQAVDQVGGSGVLKDLQPGLRRDTPLLSNLIYRN